MCQFTIEKQGMQTFLVYRLEDGEELDQACYEIIHSRQIPGLLPTFLSTKDEKQCLKYNITSRISLSQYFKEKRPNKSFIQMFQCILTTLKHCRTCTLDEQYVVIEGSYIFVNEETEEMELLFCPVIQRVEKDEIQTRLCDLVLQEPYASSENSVYIAKLAKCLMKKDSFVFDELYSLVEEIQNAKTSELRRFFYNGKIKLPSINMS